MAAAIAAVLPLAFAVPALAAGDTPDQSLLMNPPRSQQSNLPVLAQTFTAGVTGQVDRVSLQSDAAGGFPGVAVTIQNVAADGTPGSQVLGTAANPASITCCKQPHDFTFNPKVSITAGTRYAIEVQVWAGTFTWYDSGSADLYASGSAYILGRTWATSASHRDFGFVDWVATNVNSVPNVAASKSAFSVPEGTVASNSGTCSDPDGDPVTLSASSGAVSSCTNGAWSWTQQPGPDDGTQTVVITANDGQGLTNTASFTVDVTMVKPTAQILTDPLVVPEGTVVPFTGGATIPNAADKASATYTWTVTKNSSLYASGSGTAFSFIPDDDGSYYVTFGVKDDSGLSDSTSMTVTATNVAPKASILGVTQSVPLVIAADETLTFKGTFSDADTADAYTITWNFGDGMSGTGMTVTHAYAAAGTYPVTFQVSDGESGVGTATTSVTVLTTAQALSKVAGAVQNLPGLSAGQKNSLQAKLNAASAAAARGDSKAAHNQLNAFLNELQADVNTGKVSGTDAGVLAAAVRAVQGSLGTYNRFLEWWPLEA